MEKKEKPISKNPLHAMRMPTTSELIWTLACVIAAIIFLAIPHAQEVYDKAIKVHISAGQASITFLLETLFSSLFFIVIGAIWLVWRCCFRPALIVIGNYCLQLWKKYLG